MEFDNLMNEKNLLDVDNDFNLLDNDLDIIGFNYFESKEDNLSLKRFYKLISLLYDFKLSNNRMVVVFVGDTGTGKSSGCLSLGFYYYYQLGWMFDINNLIGFTAYDAILLLEKGEPGSITILEEGQSALASQNVGAVQEFMKLIQFDRFSGVHVFINVPDMKDLEKLVGKVAHIIIWCRGCDDIERKVIGTVRIRYRYQDEIYFINPDYLTYIKKGRYFKLKEDVTESMVKSQRGAKIEIPYVNNELYYEYDAKKNNWRGKLIHTMKKRIKRLSESRSGITEGTSSFEEDENDYVVV